MCQFSVWVSFLKFYFVVVCKQIYQAFKFQSYFQYKLFFFTNLIPISLVLMVLSPFIPPCMIYPGSRCNLMQESIGNIMSGKASRKKKWKWNNETIHLSRKVPKSKTPSPVPLVADDIRSGPWGGMLRMEMELWWTGKSGRCGAHTHIHTERRLILFD